MSRKRRKKTLWDFVSNNDMKGAVLTRKRFDKMVRDSKRALREPPGQILYIGSKREIELITGVLQIRPSPGASSAPESDD